MTAETLPPTRPLGEAGLWFIAGAVVLVAHVAAAVALVPAERAEPGMKEALIIEIGPEAFAAPEDMVSDQPPDIPSEASIDAPLAPEPPDPTAELLPDEPPPEPVVEPVEQALLTPPDTPPEAETPPEPPPPEPVVEDVPPPPEAPVEPEVALAAQIPPPPPRPPEPKKQLTAQRPPAPQAAPPKFDAPKAQTAVPPRMASGSTPDPKAEARWNDRVQASVARHMKKWRNPGKSVVIRMNIVVSENGQPTSIVLSGSTGDAGVDASLKAHANRLPPVPAPPPGASQRNFLIPLELARR